MPKDQDVCSVAESKPGGMKSALLRAVTRFCSLMAYTHSDVCLYALIYLPDGFFESSVDGDPLDGAQVDAAAEEPKSRPTDGELCRQ